MQIFRALARPGEDRRAGRRRRPPRGQCNSGSRDA